MFYDMSFNTAFRFRANYAHLGFGKSEKSVDLDQDAAMGVRIQPERRDKRFAVAQLRSSCLPPVVVSAVPSSEPQFVRCCRVIVCVPRTRRQTPRTIGPCLETRAENADSSRPAMNRPSNCPSGRAVAVPWPKTCSRSRATAPRCSPSMLIHCCPLLLPRDVLPPYLLSIAASRKGDMFFPRSAD